MNVKGLKISDIVSMDWERLNKLSEKDLRSLTNRLVSASNKRIRRLEKTEFGKYSYAYQKVEQRGRMFSTRGKTFNQLKQEFKLVKQFIEYKTSTISGWTKFRKDMEKRVSGATYGESQNWSEDTWKKYWEVYRKAEENHGGSFAKGDSDKLQKEIYSIFNEKGTENTTDYFSDIVEKKWEELYQKSQNELNKKTPSDYFGEDSDETELE